MESRPTPDHPLYHYLQALVHDSFAAARVPGDDGLQTYLSQLLLGFLHTDRIFSIRDADGRRVSSVADMVAEGDVLLNADSFERERQVHKHIGDFLLFWSGLYPEFLRRLKIEAFRDVGFDYARQGRESYYVASTFDYQPYTEEAKLLRRLSEGFVDYQHCLSLVRERLPNVG